MSDTGDEVIFQVEKIIEGASDDVNLESLFTIVYKVGAYLNMWRKLMSGTEEEPGFSAEWVEETAMTLFHRYFQPWTPPPGLFVQSETNDE